MNYEHWSETRKVAVIGAGTMGSGIAAHLANLGFEVTLLDLTAESVKAAFEKAKGARPPHFFLPETADKIRLGSIEENLSWAVEADWICEAIVEKLDAKRALFARLDELIPDTTAISTNTSGLEIQLLCEGRSESFKRRFMGTHFFNPPRYLKLLELIPTEDTDPRAIAAMTHFLEDKVARRVVTAKDTPGFIANRFGMWAMFHAIHVTEKLGLSIEQVDAITGQFLGRPRSASFRLNDIVGLDIMQDIATNLMSRCYEDPHMGNFTLPKSMQFLLEKGWIGDKAGQGYYRREGKEFVAFDLNTHAYRQRQEASFEELDAISREPLGVRLSKALEMSNEAGEFLRNYLIPVLKYAKSIKKEISHNVLDFDRVMMWGFGWEMGPFAMIDAIGHQKFDVPVPFYEGNTIRSYEGKYVFVPHEPQYRQIAEYPIIEQRSTFNVRDLGDHVKAISITTKMGTISPALLTDLEEWLVFQDGPLVLTSEAKHFSLGFDLNWFLERMEQTRLHEINEGLEQLQRVALLLSTKKVVSAIYGYCLGAGFELAMQCPQVVALADSMIGYPEAKVGLFPGGGGTTELGLRAQPWGIKAIVEVAKRLSVGDSSTSADHARQLGYLRPGDLTVYHPERLITEAREAAKVVHVLPRPVWSVPAGPLVGMIDQAIAELQSKGGFTDLDKLIAEKIKMVISKATSFEHALELERSLFVELCGNALTLARVKHMLETSKPLRN
ncbi:MAG: 3-hydroxyacyl-CoA dehydrogenase/enoyl-CoA hydratase family protein [Fimbriimonadaceae bacterium]